jgi:mRNA-degrading endonuclease toxin of MazEF toxin-antitoxin module
MAGRSPILPQPQRGEIWSARMPGDPPDKRARPVLIVSTDRRNFHPRANTVLAIPLSTTLTDFPNHIRLLPGETGLPEASELQPENIAAVPKANLIRWPGTRKLGEKTIRLAARYVVFSMGVQPKDL